MFLASQAHAISAQKDGRKIRRQTNQTSLEPLGGRRGAIATPDSDERPFWAKEMRVRRNKVTIER
jgi:hypothetical protein